MTSENSNQMFYGTRYRTDYLKTGTRTVVEGTSERTKLQASRTVVKTPDFRNRKARGLGLPCNPYTTQSETVRYPAGEGWKIAVWIPTGESSVYSGPTGYGFGSNGYLAVPPSVLSDSWAQIDLKILSKMKDSKLNLGNFIAERQQVLDLVSSTARRLAKAYAFLRYARNPFAAAKVLGVKWKHRRKHTAKKSAANLWLELQYGWKPLLHDVQSAAEQLAEWDLRISKKWYKASHTVQKTFSSEVTIRGVERTSRNTTMRVSKTVFYSVNSETARRLVGIGLTNPASIAWEATPYSFVVDWFLPVGKYLDNLDATLGCSFLGGYTTEKYDQDITLQGVGSEVIGNVQYTYSHSGTARWKQFDRKVVTVFPPVPSPVWKNPVSQLHVTNALALLTQVFKGK